jgi:hypothetical protein
MLKRDKLKIPATFETVQTAISAYTTLPLVSSLILAFATANIPTCDCPNSTVNDVVSTLYALCVACCLCALAGSVLTIYQASKLLADLGPEPTSNYLKETYMFRKICRSATYAAVLFFVLGYSVCLAASVETTVTSVIVSLILAVSIFASIYVFLVMKRIYDNQYHPVTSPSSSPHDI